MWYVEICVADMGQLDTDMADNEEQEGEFCENTAADEMVDHEEGEFYEKRIVVWCSGCSVQTMRHKPSYSSPQQPRKTVLNNWTALGQLSSKALDLVTTQVWNEIL